MSGPSPVPAWSDEALSALLGDAEALRGQAIADAALTAVVFVLTLAVGAVLTPNHLPPGPALLAGVAGWGVPFVLAGWVSSIRSRQRTSAYAAGARLREPALRACLTLLEDGQLARPGDDRLVAEGWRGGLPVELSTTISLAPREDDALVLRVGALPSRLRPRVVTRADAFGARHAIPDAVSAWRLGRAPHPLAEELARRFGVSVAWGPDGVEARGPSDHRLLRRDRMEALLVGAVELARACGLVAPSAGRLASGQPERQPLCPYCRDALDAAPTTACSGCATAHHAQCFAEHGRCTVFGCGRPAVRSRVTR